MFTLEAINRGHEQFTGYDFPKLIAYFKALSMVENTVDIQSGAVFEEIVPSINDKDVRIC
ncbi:hypothetical protein [Streptococcus sp. ZY19097]|uniref:hypothetical protein n=1 Tax=unclassified Streptococcus TaxID=2608887 RepID=UPI0034597FFB